MRIGGCYMSENEMSQFKGAILGRRMEGAFEIFSRCKKTFEKLSPRDANGPLLLDYMARLLDLDRSHLSLVQDKLSEFSKGGMILGRSREDCARLDLAEGIV